MEMEKQFKIISATQNSLPDLKFSKFLLVHVGTLRMKQKKMSVSIYLAYS